MPKTMPKTIPISLPMGSEVSDQLNDAVRAGKITRRQVDKLWKSLNRCLDRFGQLELRCNPEDGSISLADNDYEDEPLDKEGDTRMSVSCGTKKNSKAVSWEERFTGGKWRKVPGTTVVD